jgi:type II secretory pathway pseudopilin PulG
MGQKQHQDMTRHPLNAAGYTMVELLVVMGIFIVVVVISSTAFEGILTRAGQQQKSSETQIEGALGLELMRADLAQAGYGLPWTFRNLNTLSYLEAVGGVGVPVAGIDASLFNDTPNAPRAALGGTISATGTSFDGADYLVVKSPLVGMNSADKKWTFVNYSGTVGADSYLKRHNNADDLATDDRVVTINSTFDKLGNATYELVVDATGNFDYAVPTVSGSSPLQPAAAFRPTDPTNTFLAYGIRGKDASASVLRMPFNRADYFVARPASGMPASCAPGTGILFKAVLENCPSGGNCGGFTTYPLLDCVADLQVIFSLDTNGDGSVDYHGKEDELTGLTAQQIRSQLKDIRVYVLAQEGRKDKSYSYPNKTVTVGEFNKGRSFDLSTLSGIGNDWMRYRWKIYTIVVRPKNLN